MKHLIKKSVSLFAVSTICLSLLAGCGSTKPQETPTPTATATATPISATTSSNPTSTTRKFVDSVGREVEVPADIQKFAPSGTLAQLILYGIAPDRMVGWSSEPTKEMKKYFAPKYTELPAFGTFYGKNADLNVEALIAAKPQVVIDLGEVKKNMKGDLDALQEQLGIPVIFIESKLENMGETYGQLGELLNMPNESKALADYCDQTISDIKTKMDTIPAEKRVNVYCGEGETGLQTNPKGSIHSEVFDLLANNVADIPITSGAGGNEISMEKLLLWKPDVIIFGPNSAYTRVTNDKMWQDLKAIKDNKYYEVPMGPCNWVGRPPAVNRIIGIKWLANLLYPEQFNYDMVKEAQTFYKLFYHYDLSEQEAKDLMANSTFSK